MFLSQQYIEAHYETPEYFPRIRFRCKLYKRQFVLILNQAYSKEPTPLSVVIWIGKSSISFPKASGQ